VVGSGRFRCVYCGGSARRVARLEIGITPENWFFAVTRCV
jgi:hypothetical protein